MTIVCTYIVLEQHYCNYKKKRKHWKTAVYAFGSLWQILYSVEDSVKGRNLAKQELKDSCLRFIFKLRASFSMTDSVFGRCLCQGLKFVHTWSTHDRGDIQSTYAAVSTRLQRPTFLYDSSHDVTVTMSIKWRFKSIPYLTHSWYSKLLLRWSQVNKNVEHDNKTLIEWK